MKNEALNLKIREQYRGGFRGNERKGKCYKYNLKKKFKNEFPHIVMIVDMFIS